MERGGGEEQRREGQVKRGKERRMKGGGEGKQDKITRKRQGSRKKMERDSDVTL